MRTSPLEKCPAFWRDDRGQDLIEYTILLALVALGSVTVYHGVGRGSAVVWSACHPTHPAADTSAS